jgi:hypothetical protein
VKGGTVLRFGSGIGGRFRSVGRRRVVALVAATGAATVLGVAAWTTGCSKEQAARPDDTPTNVVVAFYESPDVWAHGVIEINGERIDREWGSEFTPDRPYTQVRLSADEGNGDPGTPRYLSMKAVYNDTHLYLLLQWNDPAADELRDQFRYLGPTLSEPIVTCSHVGGTTVCDSLYRTGPQDSLQSPSWWEQFGDDDKLALAFEVAPSGTGGESFENVGCQAACHAGAAIPFGALGYGRLDVWYWLAGRTNPVRNIFNLSDNPKDPTQGLPGYLDDWYADQIAGLVADDGWPCYLPNFEPGSHVPAHTYRTKEDHYYKPSNPDQCLNTFLGDCIVNNGVPWAYLWRDFPTVYYPPFGARDTTNQTIQPDARKWVHGDEVPGYWLTYPTDSRADVRGKATFDEDRGVWTLEVARRLRTPDPEHDVTFNPDDGKSYTFTVAVFDASTRRHWGSEPIVLRFGEKAGQAK